MDLDKLERQVLIWNRAAIVVPIFVTGILMLTYFFQLCDLETLFYIACGLYFTTAVVWWWWTMKSIHLLVYTLKGTKQGVKDVADELRSIRKELQVDKQNNK